MKKLLFIFAIVFTIQLNAQTTLEEYNYVTKGYKVQIESGLDMKKGYEFKDILANEIKERTVDLKALYKTTGGVKKKVAFLLIYTKKGSPSEYICIPNVESDQEVIGKYWNQLYNGTGDNSLRLQIISLLLTSLIDWKG